MSRKILKKAKENDRWNYGLLLVERLEGTEYRRTFQQKSLQPRQIALLCKDEIQQFQWATRPIAGGE